MKTESWPDGIELKNRWNALQKRLTDGGIDGALFYQNADLLYLCGTTQAEAVFIPKIGEPLVFAREPKERAQAEAPWTDVLAMPGSSELGVVLRERSDCEVSVVGLELDVLPVALFHRMQARSLKGFKLVDVSEHIKNVRAVKTDFEIAMIRRAAEDMAEVYASAPEILAEGVSEVELEGRLISLARGKGHQGIIRCRGFNMELFFGHVLSGKNGLMCSKVQSPTGGMGVHPGMGQGASMKNIEPNELVSVDMCGAFGGYISDQTRLFYTGRIPEEINGIYALLLELVREIEAYIRPGITAGDVYDRCFAVAEEKGLADGFMGLGKHRCPFVGHGIGVELDEWPPLARGNRIELKEKMVFAFEPRVFVSDVGVIGLEDTYVLTQDGPERLTPADRAITEVIL